MKNLCFAALLFISFNVLAQTIDYSKPSIVIKGDKAYLTHLGTESPDYSKPGYVKDINGVLKPLSKN